MSLENRKMIITGASTGLGLAMAKRFVQEGAHVAICARSSEKIQLAKDELSKYKKNVNQIIYAAACDVANQQDVNSFLENAAKSMNGVDVLICNAGVLGPKGELDEYTLSDWINTININLIGTVSCCQEALKFLKKSIDAKIIILSGGGATKGMPYVSAYAASKAGVVRFAETLAMELEKYRIDVNCIAPGAMNTKFLDEVIAAGPSKVREEYYKSSLKQKESGGAGFEKATNLAVYLSSQSSNGITGKLISAIWDPWEIFNDHRKDIQETDVYTIRRIAPIDRAMSWDPYANN
ncbi:MAG: SDR family oxidoreductase [Halobacteriovoraceae bacterium]|nr:SDR family oxidoreductase [Halobacteriovoraceae bacterium]